MDYTFQYSVNDFIPATISELVNRCFDLEPNDHLTVFDYGEKGDLRLDIYKDEDYDKERGEYNLVVIHTSQKQPDGSMVNVDDTEDIYVGNGELDRELDRIFFYEELGLL